MAQKKPLVGNSTKAEREAAKKRAWKAAQKKRAAGDYTPVSELVDADMKKNEANYVIEARMEAKKKKKTKKPTKKKPKKKYSDLLSGDK